MQHTLTIWLPMRLVKCCYSDSIILFFVITLEKKKTYFVRHNTDLVVFVLLSFFSMDADIFPLLSQFVSPSHFAHIYSEKLVHLPHCYFVNDYKQVAFLPMAHSDLFKKFY